MLRRVYFLMLLVDPQYGQDGLELDQTDPTVSARPSFEARADVISDITYCSSSFWKPAKSEIDWKSCQEDVNCQFVGFEKKDFTQRQSNRKLGREILET